MPVIQWGLHKSYSQLNQDITVLRYYGFKRGGYFLDIGANDGITLSNTYLLEKKYQWKGICVEPDPTVYKKLVKARPNSICIDKAVYHTSDLTLDFTVNNNNLLSGISETIRSSITGDNMPIQTISINDLLKNANAPYFIDYLSIDTEGSEYHILKTLDFNTYKFGIIHVEHNYEEPKRSEIRSLLLNNGYLFVRENKWDDEYRLQ